MKPITLCCLVAAVVLAACASPGPGRPEAGRDGGEISAQMGSPRATYALPNGGKRLEFARARRADLHARRRCGGPSRRCRSRC